MIGIYKFTNKINGKHYIGQSKNIMQRKQKHYNTSQNTDSKDYFCSFHCAIRKYGFDNFSFEVLEECSVNELNEKECYYIQKYNSIVPNGYNMTLGGSSSHSIKLNIEQLQEIDQLLIHSQLTNQEIANLFQVHENMISGINTGLYWKRDNIDYPIRKHFSLPTHCKECGQPISSSPQGLCFSCATKKRRVVSRPEPRQLVKEIIQDGFSAVGKKYGVSDNAIRKWCKAYDLPTKKQELKEWYNRNL